MANSKNFGIIGVGSDVQFGKGNGRYIWNTDHFEAKNSTSSAYVDVYVPLSPGNAQAAASKSYVDSLVQGLAPKDSVRAGTTTAGTLATSFANGSIIDGVTLATGDRVLIKNQATASENGIYVVNASGAPTRAADANTSAEMGAAFTFIEEGTTNATTGWVTTFKSSQVLGTDPVNWVQFSSAGTYTASNGITLVGSDFRLNFPGLSTATIATADTLAFYDASGTVHASTTVANFLSNLNIITTTQYPTTAQNEVNALDALGNGIVAKTADATYANRTISVNGAGNLAGLAISNGDGIAGNPTLGLNLNGLTARSDAISGSDKVPVYNVSTGANEYYLISEIASAGTIGAVIQDTNGDTSVNTETSANEDTIRFNTGNNHTGYPAVSSIMAIGSNAWTVAMGTANVAATTGATISLTAGTGNTTGTGGTFGITGGAGGATGTGGAVTITGGAGGSTSGNAAGVTIQGGTPVGGAGGSISISGSAGVGTNQNGGSVTVSAGAGTGTGTAGTINITAGALGGAGTAGNVVIAGGAGNGSTTGGQVQINGGSGGTTGTGASVVITAGAGGSTSGNGGAVTVQGGSATAGAGGSVSVLGATGVGTNQNGGGVTITAGNPTGTGTPGSVSITAGALQGAGTPATVSITGGAGSSGTTGGAVNITGGSGGSTGIGAGVVISGGPGGSTSGAGGTITIQGGTATSGAGGAVTVTGRTGVGTNQTGGALTLTGGDATGTGTAGSVSIKGGALAGAGTAGAVTLQGGNGSGATTGGAANITGGTGGTTGAGANVVITGGAGGSTSGNAGSVTVQGGTPVSGTGAGVTLTGTAGVGTNQAGGGITLNAGAATGTGTPGSISLTAGALGGAGTPATVSITGGAGNGSTTGGAVTITAGSGGTTGAGAAVTVKGGPGGSTSGNAGGVTITGGTPVAGAGGTVTISGSAGVGTNQNGGGITLTAGNPTGTGTPGSVSITAGALQGIGTPATVSITGGAGNGSTTGGAVTILGGSGGTTGAGAGVTLQGGPGGSTSGNGGAATVLGGTPVSGTGGAVNITAAAGVGTNQAGGTVTITAGAATGTGAPGVITLSGTASAVRVPLGVAADEAALTTDGMIRYDSTATKFRVRENGAWVDMRSSTALNFGTFTPSGNSNAISIVADTTSDIATLTASTGIQIDGTAATDTLTFTFTRSGMTDTAVATGDTIPFFDLSASNVPQYRSFSSIFSDLSVPSGITTTGLVTLTAANTYAGRTITASATSGLQGISITNGDGVAGNPTIGLSISGLTANTTIAGTDALPIYDGTNNKKVTWSTVKTQFAADVTLHQEMIATVTYNGGATQVIGSLPATARVIRARVTIDTPWTTAETISIGINGGSATAIMATSENDPTAAAEYDANLNYRNASGSTQTVQAAVTNALTPTAGSATVIVEYFTNSSI